MQQNLKVMCLDMKVHFLVKMRQNWNRNQQQLFLSHSNEEEALQVQ